MGRQPSKEDTMIHPTAIIETDQIGEGTKIWAFTHVCKGAKIGKNCTIGEGVYIGPNVVIGDNCRIQNGAQIFEGVTIGSHVFIGPCVCFTNDRRPDLSKEFIVLGTYVHSNVVIGANCTIICGITINPGAFIGAGSVVTKTVRSQSTVYGNPAK